MDTFEGIISRPGRVFERETFASVLPLPKSSRSMYIPIPGIRVIEDAPITPEGFRHYAINDYFENRRFGDASNENTYSKFVEVLRRNPALSRCSISTDSSIGDMAENKLVSNGRQRVDVIIKEGSLAVLLIEVESSNDVENTISKLATGIMSQILYLRKCGNFIDSLKGFFLPVNRRFGEEVTGTFVEDGLVFQFERNALEFNNVVPSIVRAWRDQKDISPIHGISSVTLPLSPAVITSKFGTNSRQVSSGLSVVIHDADNRSFYKHCLVSNDSQFRLYLEPTRPTLSVYPDGQPIIFLKKFFFKYPAMLPPLKKRDISSGVLIKLVNGTIAALQELHDLGYAHNDVRLENICFTTDHKPVLIDLERKIEESGIAFRGGYGSSTMYTHIQREWTYKQSDYRQLSIMITYIQSTDPCIQYHSIQVDDTAHEFLKNMFNQGMLYVVYLA